ncbi:unnamed protein product, partial [Cyprideis torosa]
PNEYETIIRAIRILDFATCISFVPRNASHRDYLSILPQKEPKGCWSSIGRIGGKQKLSLQKPEKGRSKCLGGPGRAIHEIMHSLGVFHEQSRSDRDNYINVIWDNVKPGTHSIQSAFCFKHNFNVAPDENVTFNFEYDYNSIMHYGSKHFSVKGKRTILPKKSGVVIGQRVNLSKTDCMKLNAMYGCLDQDAFAREKYTTICSAMGL